MSTRYHNTNLLDDEDLNEIKRNYQKELKKHNLLFQENQKIEDKILNLEKDISYLTDVMIDITKMVDEKNNNLVNTKYEYGFNYLFLGIINMFVYLSVISYIFFYITGNYPIHYKFTDQTLEFDPIIFEMKDIIWNQTVSLQQKIHSKLV